jgi:hypothetical protein
MEEVKKTTNPSSGGFTSGRKEIWRRMGGRKVTKKKTDI